MNRIRTPVILQHSFRPFFLLAGTWATLSVLLWVGSLAGLAVLPDAVDAFAWHKHEILFGFATAAIAGFILTAIPNWTGGLPISGWPLASLVGLWLLGRLAFLLPELLGPWAVAALDLSFLFVLVATIARELIGAGNRRNFPVLGLIALIAIGNVLVHLQRLGLADTADSGYRLGIFILAMLIAMIGGRIVPSFTRNWLKKQGAATLPAAMDIVDKVALGALALLVVAEVAAPQLRATAAMAVAVGILHAWRLARWKGGRVLSEPLLWVLHLGYAWLAFALLLIGLAGLTDLLPLSAALHALTMGAFGTMILAVATRASLGHTGRPLTAGAGTTAAYLLISVAAMARVTSPLLGELELAAMWISGGAWTLGYGLFTVLYFPVFTKPRPGRTG
jgi:uncharacterized protein involved in response to NO